MGRDPIKILIVDDDERVLIELERLLESEGYRTATAWSDREALALSENSKFDLLLVDEYLGGRDSSSLVHELKRKQPHALPVLMHTGADQRSKQSANWVCKWEHAEMKALIRECLAA